MRHHAVSIQPITDGIFGIGSGRDRVSTIFGTSLSASDKSSSCRQIMNEAFGGKFPITWSLAIIAFILIIFFSASRCPSRFK